MTSQQPNDPLQVAIGQRLRAARKRRFGSLVDMQRATGLSAIRIGTYERGDRWLGAAEMHRLAAVFGVSSASLLPPDDLPLTTEVAEELRLLADRVERTAAPC